MLLVSWWVCMTISSINGRGSTGWLQGEIVKGTAFLGVDDQGRGPYLVVVFCNFQRCHQE